MHDPLSPSGAGEAVFMIVERFLQWARTASVSRRASAAHALARAYLYSDLGPTERDQVEAAMTVLLDDRAIEVRQALADALAESDEAPHHMILSLAADRTSIAAIVVERSPVILDSELVDMIGTRDEPIRIAIARRPYVSRVVCAALSEVGSAEVCTELLCNPGARVPRFSLDRIVDRHARDSDLRQILLERNDLPLEIRSVLLNSLAEALRDIAVARNWLSADRARLMARDACQRATIAASFEAPADEIPALAQQLIDADELTPAFLIRAAVSGQTLLFETALAALSGVPQRRVNALLSSGRAASLKALFERAGLPERTFPVFAAAIDAIRAGEAVPDASTDYRRATHLIDAIVTRYQAGADRELDQILALLRRFATEAKRAAARGYAREILEAA